MNSSFHNVESRPDITAPVWTNADAWALMNDEWRVRSREGNRCFPLPEWKQRFLFELFLAVRTILRDIFGFYIPFPGTGAVLGFPGDVYSLFDRILFQVARSQDPWRKEAWLFSFTLLLTSVAGWAKVPEAEIELSLGWMLEYGRNHLYSLPRPSSEGTELLRTPLFHTVLKEETDARYAEFLRWRSVLSPRDILIISRMTQLPLV
ncbi:hypothetical protein HD553DRAFT_343005 [Filobasidium floriforme]|uniref:uncharacterized protein n=1 Tax=Filobasidium floriforme TaxID=5210 RepID=UPI001E8CB1D5|nr:uncharacterized protein HD553DRAFT_343005 [Filobasidium floriforme]KAH8083024.1 hypothetical protein HD553DRAFT_343005 [Filobasidium floriforme]